MLKDEVAELKEQSFCENVCEVNCRRAKQALTLLNALLGEG